VGFDVKVLSCLIIFIAMQGSKSMEREKRILSGEGCERPHQRKSGGESRWKAERRRYGRMWCFFSQGKSKASAWDKWEVDIWDGKRPDELLEGEDAWRDDLRLTREERLDNFLLKESAKRWELERVRLEKGRQEEERLLEAMRTGVRNSMAGAFLEDGEIDWREGWSLGEDGKVCWEEGIEWDTREPRPSNTEMLDYLAYVKSLAA